MWKFYQFLCQWRSCNNFLNKLNDAFECKSWLDILRLEIILNLNCARPIRESPAGTGTGTGTGPAEYRTAKVKFDDFCQYAPASGRIWPCRATLSGSDIMARWFRIILTCQWNDSETRAELRSRSVAVTSCDFRVRGRVGQTNRKRPLPAEDAG